MMLAKCGQQVDDSRVPNLPQPSDDFGLSVGSHVGKQLGHDIARVGFFEQTGAKVYEQPRSIRRS